MDGVANRVDVIGAGDTAVGRQKHKIGNRSIRRGDAKSLRGGGWLKTGCGAHQVKEAAVDGAQLVPVLGL